MNEKNKDEVPAYIKEMRLQLISTLNIEVEKQVLTIGEVVQRLQRQGMDKKAIKELLRQDLREGGVLFGEFRNKVKARFRQNIEDHARGQLVDEWQDTKKWDWLGIADNIICPECLKRHQMAARTFNEWEAIGLPGTATPCNGNCRCTLVPAGSVTKNEKGIIKKEFE